MSKPSQSKYVIWKFTLALEDYQVIEMPAGAVLLSVQIQHGSICIWARVDPNASKQDKHFWIAGTGHFIPTEALGATFLGTLQLQGGHFVFHVFYS